MLMNSTTSPVRGTAAQAGFISIVVSLIIGVVLSLITIGFAQLMSREQKDATERQLSTQAFYAAESGVNDMALKIKNTPGMPDVTTCASSTTTINSAGPVEISCVLTDSKPTALKFDGISTDASKAKVIPINTNLSDLKSISLQWVGSSGSELFRTDDAATFPQASSWLAKTGMLKVSLVPFTNNDSREKLIEATAIVYLNPLVGNGSEVTVDYDKIKGMNGQGSILNAKCDTAQQCRVKIKDVPTTASNFYVIVTSVYKPNNISITAQGTSGNLELTGVQTVIDSTGRTNGVLRRIQVRKPLLDSYLYAGGALDTPNSICKLIITSPEETSDSCGL